ncbi:hypothetical protein HMPREF0973_01365 [Prevotella veroralis F0319]|uniref:Uncharacterized protein n=1 Tax=Prevotella veroralis F0319 TaxID=649761 RepID=C9MP28_9BACT|nr:hypothetical protein HMPREF0973_01365 [Prevotella veroralis F0319]
MSCSIIDSWLINRRQIYEFFDYKALLAYLFFIFCLLTPYLK